MSEKLLTTDEVAAVFRLKRPQTIAAWCRKGTFPNAFKIAGDKWLIPEADLAYARPNTEVLLEPRIRRRRSA